MTERAPQARRPADAASAAPADTAPADTAPAHPAPPDTPPPPTAPADAAARSVPVLIPSAKLVATELQVDLGRIPSAMIPLGGRPAFTHIAAAHAASASEVIVAVHERADAVSSYLAKQQLAGVRALDVGPTSSLAQTILVALDSLDPLPDEVVVQYADTFISEPIAPGMTIGVAEATNLYRWTCCRLDARGDIDLIVDRFVDKPEPAPIFIGVFRIPRLAEFRDALRLALDEPGGRADAFYRTLKGHYNRTPASQRQLQPMPTWHDVGHLDTYYRAKQAYFLNKRHFNDLDIQRERSAVRKESTESKKLLNEIYWYLKLPKNLAHLAPRIFDWSIDPIHPWVEMEFYGYLSLSDMYLFGDHDPGTWSGVFDAIGAALDAMGRFRFEPDDPAAVRRALRDMYEGKTLSRLQASPPPEHLRPFWQPELELDGVPCAGVPTLLANLEEVARWAGLYRPTRLSVIHGDLCLSNILYDARNAAVRLVDPRGSFGELDIYGDPRYELAKLSHSLDGDYDFLVNGMFSSRWTERGFAYEAHTDARHQHVKRLFARWLDARAGEDRRAVALIEALLFVSMTPLHHDRPASQEAMLARGLSLFSRLLRERRADATPAEDTDDATA